MILIIHTKPSHLAAIFISLAILLTLAGALRGYHHQADQRASIVRAYYGALEAEHRITRIENHVEDIEFAFQYATAFGVEHD